MINPEDGDGCDFYGRQESMRTALQAHGDAPPILAFGEHVFDRVTSPVAIPAIMWAN
jgi:hypothetical protein